MPDHAGDTYDWIGFDLRGVGSSKPALRCIPDYFGYNRPDYVPVTRALERTWLGRARSNADACEATAALLLRMKTIDSALDIDSIRRALGASRINFYGFSYVVGPGDDNGYAVYNAVQCTDVQWPTNWNGWRRDNWRILFKAPFLSWYNAPCRSGARAGRPVRVDGRHVAGALLIDETPDAATPFEDSFEVRRRLPNSSMIAEPARHLARLHALRQRLRRRPDCRLPGQWHAAGPQAGERPDATCAPLPQPAASRSRWRGPNPGRVAGFS